MPGGKWGVEVREEIAGNHYVTPRPPPRFIRLRTLTDLRWAELVTAFHRVGLGYSWGQPTVKEAHLGANHQMSVEGRGGEEGRCGKYSADCREEPKKETTFADLLSVFLAQGHAGLQI